VGLAVQLIKGVIPFTPYPYVGQELPCNICSSPEKSVLSDYDRRIKKLRTVICSNCGLLRTDPMPTEAELADYYRTSYRFDYQMAGSKPPRFHLTRSKKLAGRRLEMLRPAIFDGARVLDFGSGSGEFLAACKAENCEVTGIEPGESYARYAEETYGVKVFSSPWEQTDLGPRKFDLITSFHVFEHLRDPRAALNWLCTHLADDGVVALSVPNMTRNAKSRHLFEDLHFAHVHGFVPETLELLGRRCGLEPDARFATGTTDQMFQKSNSKSAAPSPDPQFAENLAATFQKNDLFNHLIKFGWVVDAVNRARRDVKDTFKSK